MIIKNDVIDYMESLEHTFNWNCNIIGDKLHRSMVLELRILLGRMVSINLNETMVFDINKNK